MRGGRRRTRYDVKKEGKVGRGPRRHDAFVAFIRLSPLMPQRAAYRRTPVNSFVWHADTCERTHLEY
jgi:hypothetical protein